MTRAIATIDRHINANRRELLRRHPVSDLMSSAQWQAARDACPDLVAREHELFRERGQAQLDRAEREIRAERKAARAERAKGRRAVYHKLNVRVDATFDEFLTKLGCRDGRDAAIISHWQDDPAGFRIQVTRLSDGKALTRFVAVEG
jgi:hypothetical protein